MPQALSLKQCPPDSDQQQLPMLTCQVIATTAPGLARALELAGRTVHVARRPGLLLKSSCDLTVSRKRRNQQTHWGMYHVLP